MDFTHVTVSHQLIVQTSMIWEINNWSWFKYDVNIGPDMTFQKNLVPFLRKNWKNWIFILPCYLPNLCYLQSQYFSKDGNIWHGWEFWHSFPVYPYIYSTINIFLYCQKEKTKKLGYGDDQPYVLCIVLWSHVVMNRLDISVAVIWHGLEPT